MLRLDAIGTLPLKQPLRPRRTFALQAILAMAEPRQLYWINQFTGGNLAIMPAPRLDDSLESSILAWKGEGVDVVVSLLEQPEVPNLIDAECALCEEFGLEFFSFPIPDKTVPEAGDSFADIARRLADRIAGGKSV